VSGGVGAVAYQWRKGGVDVPDATDAVLTLDPIGFGDADTYACHVSDLLDSFLSSNAVVTVAAPIQITAQPTGGTYDTGQAHTFSLTATGGYGSLSYQWRHDVAPIDGATLSAYAIDPLRVVNSGDYSCDVTDEWLTTVSTDSVALVVNGTLDILGQPEGGVAYIGEPFTFTIATAGGDGAVAYQWHDDSKAPIVGATDDAYTIPEATPAHAGAYTCHVFDEAPTELISVPATLEVADPIDIVVQPEGAGLDLGGAHTLAIGAVGGYRSPPGNPLHYQWKKDEAPIPDATNATYGISDADETHAGSYICEVSDDMPTYVASQPAVVAVVTGMPVGGVATLGLAAAACAVAGAVAARRRRQDRAR